MPVVGDEDHRAGIVVQRVDQRLAAVDVEVVRRLVEDQQVRARRRRRAPSSAAPSRRPRDCAAAVAIFSVVRPICAVRARTFASGASGISARTWSIGRMRRVQRFQLVLREKADLQLRRAHDLARLGRGARPATSLAKVDLPLPLTPRSAMRSSSSMRRSRLRQHRLARLVADRDAFHAHDRRRERPLGIGEAEGERVLLGDLGDRLQLGDSLQPRLRLPRLRGLVAKAVDERLHVLALGDLLDALLLLQRLPLAILPLERIVAAAPDR